LPHASEDNSVLTEQSCRTDLTPARKARITVQRARSRSQRNRCTGEHNRNPNTRTYDEPMANVCVMTMVIGIAYDRQRTSPTHVKAQPREEDAAREVLRDNEHHRGQGDTANQSP